MMSSATTVEGSDLAGGERRRRYHRARCRGGRPSRHIPDRQYRQPARQVRVGAAGGRCGQSACDRGRRHRRRAWHRRGFVLGASGGAIGTAYLCPEVKVTAPRSPRSPGEGRPHRTHQCHDRTPRARRRQPRHARGRPDLALIAPAFPLAATALAPLKRNLNRLAGDFTYHGRQAVHIGREMPAADLPEGSRTTRRRCWRRWAGRFPLGFEKRYSALTEALQTSAYGSPRRASRSECRGNAGRIRN